MPLDNSINYLAVTDMHNNASIQNIAPKWKLKDFAMVIITIACLILTVNTIGTAFNASRLILNSPYHHWWNLVLFLVQEAIFYYSRLCPYYKKISIIRFGVRFCKNKILADHKMDFKRFRTCIFIQYFICINNSAIRDRFSRFRQTNLPCPAFRNNSVRYFLGIIVLIIIAPVVEEFIFRGFVLQTFLGKFKPIIANIISAGIFAIIHFEFQSIGIILFLAFVFKLDFYTQQVSLAVYRIPYDE